MASRWRCKQKIDSKKTGVHFFALSESGLLEGDAADRAIIPGAKWNSKKRWRESTGGLFDYLKNTLLPFIFYIFLSRFDPRPQSMRE
jgi:hypothetical protein